MSESPPVTLTAPLHASLRARIFQQGVPAGDLYSMDGAGWRFVYLSGYAGPPVSLALPLREESYDFEGFPPFLEGLLPEGPQLDAILRKHKIDRADCFRQLMAVGHDVVGSLTIVESGRREGASA